MKDTRGQTALGLASEVGDVSIMRLLLAKGAEVDSRNQEGETPLFKAATSLRADAVRLLLEHHASVNVPTTWYGSVRNGQIALLKLTPLHQAATFGPPDMVRSLLKAGAEVNVRDSRGLAALTFAV